ncbi:4Fe-4S binding protein [Candidatus Pacearchaeota archaeon]|nr:4Fe-4S binding protein [Candidatus Pacearchaeota archaeon]
MWNVLIEEEKCSGCGECVENCRNRIEKDYGHFSL